VITSSGVKGCDAFFFWLHPHKGKDVKPLWSAHCPIWGSLTAAELELMVNQLGRRGYFATTVLLPPAHHYFRQVALCR
jgi:hypothetical protein